MIKKAKSLKEKSVQFEIDEQATSSDIGLV